jgi:YfiR/HmsC-like
MLLVTARALQAQVRSEPELKAQIVLRSLLFVEWPADMLRAGQHLSLCLSEPGPLADTLEGLAGQSVNGHRIEVRRTSPGQWSDCHVAHVGAAALAAAAPQSLPRGLLLVGDTHALTERGAMLNLMLDQGRLAFDIDLPATRRAGLGVSARLLRLARFVRNDH